MINLLVGLSYGKPEFESTHAEIATRLSRNVQLTADEPGKGWAKRAHRELRKWQDQNQLNLIEYEPGGRSKDKTRHYKSGYRLHIFFFADEIVKRAQQNPLWDKDKLQAIKKAAEELRPKYQPTETMYHRGRRSSGNKLHRYIQSSISYMRLANEILDGDKTVILIEDEVIVEFEETLKKLKKHLLRNSFGEEWDV